MNARRHVLVVGAGIGGLASAIGLRLAGIDSTVFERADDVEAIQVGAGPALWGNAVRALRLLGLDEQAFRVCSRLERMVPRTSRGAVVADWPLGEMAKRHGFPAIGISRPERHKVLLGGVDASTLRLGSACARVEADDRGVTIQLADGSTVRGDALVAADGMRSVVRSQLHGDDEPRYSGQTSWRALVAAPCDVPPAFQLFRARMRWSPSTASAKRVRTGWRRSELRRAAAATPRAAAKLPS